MKILKLTLIFAVALILVFVLMYWRGISSAAGQPSQDVIFFIAPGETVKQISTNLYQAGLIKSKFYFELYVWRSKNQARLQAGQHILNPDLSIKEVVRVLASGLTQEREKVITVIEGWDIYDIGGYLEKNGLAVKNEFINLTLNFRQKLPNLASYQFLSALPKAASLEGYLFPDTYRVFKEATAAEIIEKMLNNFSLKLTERMKSDIAAQNKSLADIIIMASIIEKEVRTPGDMKIVSGIFWDRLKYGQALQSDATLSYYLQDKQARHTADDLKLDTPYNTYKYPGLPPGPISNPGLNAIRAAIYPEDTDYNYFLNRQDSGETIFSRSLEEHNLNKARYLR